LDIDHFKKFNDTYGHQQGDIVLKTIASIISSSLRESDIAARYGGEEFAVILPQTDMKGALVCAERIRQNVEEHKLSLNGTPVQVTVSLGVSSVWPSKKDVPKGQFIEITDRALYHSKNNGRNRVTALEI
ncbi:MAG: GGDEF domain-containing protein, partial [Nitrospirae bacterium]